MIPWEVQKSDFLEFKLWTGIRSHNLKMLPQYKVYSVTGATIDPMVSSHTHIPN